MIPARMWGASATDRERASAPFSIGDGGALPSTIDHLLELQGRQWPDAIAIVAPGRRPLTYGRLAGQARETIESLNAIGIGHGDRVAVALPGGAEMASAVLALAAGATCAPLNPTFRKREYEAYLGRLGARALVVRAGVDSPARAAAAGHGIPIIDLSPASGTEAGLFTLTSSRRRRPTCPVGAAPEGIALLLPTSGTVSGPKLVPLNHANLCASAHTMRASLRLGPPDRCLNLMPLFHVHGFMALLSSLAAGASVACPPAFDASRVFEWIDECRPTWYTAVPAVHRALLALAEGHRDVVARRPLRFIRSCSAPLPDTVRVGLERVFGTPVIEAYGMTEASHQIAANPLPPKERRAGSVGLATGSEIAIVDGSGMPLPTAAVGEVVIRGPSVMRGYLGDAEADTNAFFGDWFRTGDLGRLDPDGYLFLIGRLKEIINRGGEKISPVEIDQILAEHPSVAEAVTFAVPHPTLGEDLVTAVVLQGNAELTVRDLREFAAARLADFKVPGRVMILPEIPKGETGKPKRLRLAEQLGLATLAPGKPAPGVSVSPWTATEAALADIWAGVLGVRAIGIHDDFFEMGGDSIMAALIASRVRETFGAELAVRDIFDIPTVAGLASLIDSERLLHR
jgi:oxalate---CoA ligase